MQPQGRRGYEEEDEEGSLVAPLLGPSDPGTWEDEEAAAAPPAVARSAFLRREPGAREHGERARFFSSSAVAAHYAGGADGARRYTLRYLHLGAWLLAVLAGYLIGRLSCWAGLPSDCLREVDFYEVFSDITSTVLFGALLGWYVGATDAARFAWLFSRRRWWLWAVFAGTPPVFSAISDLPALKHSLVDFRAWGVEFIAVEALGLSAILALIAYHCRLAYRRRRSWQELAAYAAARGVVLLWFAASAAALALRGGVRIHLHHLYIGWSLALWSEFNTLLSGLTLAVGTGIFVQGVAAYSFAPVFEGGGCFATPAAAALRCSFSAPAPFSLFICPGAGGMPAHTCR